MNDDDGPQVEFVTNLPPPQSDSILPGLGIRPRIPSGMTPAVVEERVRDAVTYMSRYLNSLAQEAPNDHFELAEAEFTLLVTETGKVTIVVADVGAQIQGGIKLKWRRK
jgi:hypothetical protein